MAIAGAGAVGRSIAAASLHDGHKVLLIERRRDRYRPALVPDADWMLADACELAALERAGISTCDTVMAATGDDKANLVFSMLAKAECGVPRVVARVNDPGNEWLFTHTWGVDVAVSTPRALVAGVDEALTIGDIVHVMTLQHSQADILEITLPSTTAFAGVAVRELPLPAGAAVLTLVRNGAVLAAGPDTRLLPDDSLLLAAEASLEPRVRAALREQAST